MSEGQGLLRGSQMKRPELRRQIKGAGSLLMLQARRVSELRGALGV